jgi:hypothetical protein
VYFTCFAQEAAREEALVAVLSFFSFEHRVNVGWGQPIGEHCTAVGRRDQELQTLRRKLAAQLQVKFEFAFAEV